MAKAGRAIMATIAAACAFAALGPGSAAAATISGTVSDEVTHVGIAGVVVCPQPSSYGFEPDCTETNSSGNYALAELPIGQYMVSFSGERNNLPFVNEYYDNRTSNLDADLVTLSSGSESRQLDVALAEGGSISGTLTDSDSGEPVAGMTACARAYSGGYERCSKSDGAGEYQVNGLPSGEYTVRYVGWNLVNYLASDYGDGRVPVVAPTSTAGIDAELEKGAEILGHISDVETGMPLNQVMVCAGEQADPERGDCSGTDVAGNYAFRGMHAGTYLLEFGVANGGPFARTVGQWWNGATTIDEADPITISPPESLAGIDGELPYWYGTPLPVSSPGSESEEEPSTPRSPPPSLVQRMPIIGHPSIRRCRKGFHRKLVKGKRRCVRKYRRHRGHHRTHR